MDLIEKMQIANEDLDHLIQKDGGKFNCSCADEAYAFCEKIAKGHYENFPVGSLFIPKAKRKHVFAVYCFARIADDIADELDLDKAARLKMLNDFDALQKKGYNDGNPVFMALADTKDKLKIPDEPFTKLIRAFSRDVDFRQPEDMKDLFDYCSNSANPVGELVLRIFGLYNEKTAKYSDNICTALQLANFWQDFSLDLNKNRVYIPISLMTKYGINYIDASSLAKNEKTGHLLNELYDLTQKLFEKGKPLIKYLKPLRLKWEITATIKGGESILHKTRSLGNNIFFKRPKLTKADIFSIFIKSIRI